MSKNLHAALVRRLLEFPYLPSSLDVVDAALDLIEVKPGRFSWILAVETGEFW
jgi:hypothetical protein